MNPVEHFIVSYAYTLPSFVLGIAVVYFTYVKSSKFAQKHVVIGLLISWSIFAFIIFLFGENSFGDNLLTPVLIGYVVFYLLRKKVQNPVPTTTSNHIDLPPDNPGAQG